MVVRAWAVLEREEPVEQRVAHYLLQICDRAAEVEGVFAWNGLQDCEDVLFFWGWVGGCLGGCGGC